jgi:hypothetical protein
MVAISVIIDGYAGATAWLMRYFAIVMMPSGLSVWLKSMIKNSGFPAGTPVLDFVVFFQQMQAIFATAHDRSKAIGVLTGF